jgi:hypothetical protein
MPQFRRVDDSEEARARARLLAHFEDHQEAVFYSRQLEVMFEREFFHWVTNRAIRRLVEEGRIVSEARKLDLGSEIKLLWHRKYRFYKRAAADVFELVNRYSTAATDGTLGLQGEHLVLAAFARTQHVLLGEEVNAHGGIQWTESEHNLDFIFGKGGNTFGVEVKNTLGYLDIDEFVIKVKMALMLGIKPVFAVRYIPKTWADALIQAGGYAMIMGFQFYPWTHLELAKEIREKLHLPVDTPRRIEAGTMQKFENWVAQPSGGRPSSTAKIDALLRRFKEGRRMAAEIPDLGEPA